jgi:AcrR family transcriptional regulator
MALTRKKQRPKLSARERILEAATKLFTERPFGEISADDIAREADVAHGLTFHHFGSKAALYECISQAAADRLDGIAEPCNARCSAIGCRDRRFTPTLPTCLRKRRHPTRRLRALRG